MAKLLRHNFLQELRADIRQSEEVTILVSYISLGGLRLLLDEFYGLKRVRVLVGQKDTKGVELECILNNEELREGTRKIGGQDEYAYIREQKKKGVLQIEFAPKEATKGIVHAKGYMLDTRCVYIGSNNMTEGGLVRNLEYAIRVEDPQILAEYKEEYEKMWGMLRTEKLSYGEYVLPSRIVSAESYVDEKERRVLEIKYSAGIYGVYVQRIQGGLKQGYTPYKFKQEIRELEDIVGIELSDYGIDEWLKRVVDEEVVIRVEKTEKRVRVTHVEKLEVGGENEI